jgi:hypothetical protein
MFAIPFRVFMFLLAFFAGVITSYSVFAQDDSAAPATAERYDRLDGTGDSGKKVDVIEWEGNLEIHSSPRTSLKGLSAKLDNRDQGKSVMVIGYRFANTPRPLVRRAILGIPFNAKVKAYIDPTEKDYDKLAITNQNLTAPWVPYKLEASPKQWYPDGDERNQDDAAPADKPVLSANPVAAPNDNTFQANAPAVKSKGAPVKRVPASQDQDNDGAIKDFSW